MILDITGGKRCKRFESESRVGFRLITTSSGDYIQSNNIEYFNLVFLLEGKIEFSCGDSLKECFCKDDFFFLPRGSEIYGVSVNDSRMLVLSFDNKVDIPCDNCILYNYLDDLGNMDAEKEPCPALYVLHATPQIKLFEELVLSYLSSDVMKPCTCLYEMKQRELFIVLTYNYTKKELAKFFSPIVGFKSTFRQNFLTNYKAGRTIGEIASKMNMSMRNFSRLFCQEFGQNARSWFLEQKAKNIKVKLSVPGITISDIIMLYDFTDLSHFTKFCKHYYGCAPADLLRQVKENKASSPSDQHD